MKPTSEISLDNEPRASPPLLLPHYPAARGNKGFYIRETLSAKLPLPPTNPGQSGRGGAGDRDSVSRLAAVLPRSLRETYDVRRTYLFIVKPLLRKHARGER